jgi:MFS family permease
MISLQRYAALLARHDLRAAITASVLGRLPIGITGLSILMLGQAVSGSFAMGGVLTAAYITGLACLAPVLGRLIDRNGPRIVLLRSALAFPVALCALVLSVRSHGPEGSLLSMALAFAAGASFPPITVCMRTYFRQRLGQDAQLSTAYSLESVLIELIFIAGPLLVAALLVIAPPEVPVLVAASCGGIGTWLFLRSPALRHWQLAMPTGGGWLGPLAAQGFIPLLAVIVGYASAFGLVEIGVVGYAAEFGDPALGGILLSLMSLGSAVGGLVYGSRTWRSPLHLQFATALALMGIGVAMLAPVSDVWFFAALSLVAGLVMAPALTIQSMLVAKTAAQAHATEAFTWSSTGLLLGVSAGMAGGGWVIETWGPGTTFSIAGAAALLSGSVALRLRPHG